MFKVWPGKFNTAAINAWFTKHAETPSAGSGWRYARMDSARGNLGSAVTGNWTGSAAQMQAKTSGLAHLILGSAEYQFL